MLFLGLIVSIPQILRPLGFPCRFVRAGQRIKVGRGGGGVVLGGTGAAGGDRCDEEERRAANGHADQVSIEGLMSCYSESKKTMMRALDVTLHPVTRAGEA